MSFLSDADYSRLLDRHIRTVGDTVVQDHIRAKLGMWREHYLVDRAIERMEELLTTETSRPQSLYLRCRADLHFLPLLTRRHRFNARLFQAFLVEDSLWDSVKPEWFASFPLHRVSEWEDTEDTAVFTFSDSRPFRDNGRDRGNDYLERFIDLSRASSLASIRRQADRPVVLYVDYRKVRTLEAIGEAVSDRYTTVGLIPDLQVGNGSGYNQVVAEPHLYLWPLLIQKLDADVVHMNVGWSIQGLPFLPFVPDARRTIVDFYDVVELTPDAAEGNVEECALVQASERYIWNTFDHFAHRCFEPITEDLRRKNGKEDVVSVIEYVKEPMCSHVRDGAEDLKIAYAGIIIQNAAETDSIYYRRFMAMVDLFARDNLHLHIYPSPYLYGLDEPKAVQELIRAHGLANVHACKPLEEDELVRAISTCDYGMSPPADRDFHMLSYSLPHKVIAYLRAGLPILVPEDLSHLAAVVKEYGIGVVYSPNDAGHMQEILRRQNLRELKENVVKFRSKWHISKAADKTASMYQRVLKATTEKSRTTAFVTAGKKEQDAPGDGNCLQGYLLEDRLVRIAPDSLRFGGSWQGRPRDGHPTAWDMGTIKFFYDQLAGYENPGVLDIGANTGSFCLLAAFHQGMHGHAFEPVPHIYDILRANIALNGLDGRMKAHRLALTDRNGTSVLKYPKSGRESGMSCLGNPKRFSEWIEFQVECRTLDAIAEQQNGLSVDFMKIDTEGCEWFVLQGAKKLIREQMPSILLEYYEPNTRQFGYDPAEILKLLRSLGYTQCERVGREDIYCPRPTRVMCTVPGNEPAETKEAGSPSLPDKSVFQGWLNLHATRGNRLYYRDQSARTMASLAGLAQQFDPTVIVELGTLGGLSLRTWIAATQKARIYAVDLSFQTLRETQEFLPVDLSRVTLLEQDILKVDFSRLWMPQDRVIFFVDAHDLPNVPIMTHVLTTAASSLPDGSVVVIDDLWFSGERLTPTNARAFLEGAVVNEIDELQCFHAHFAPYHEGGSFMGFAEVIPLLRFVNEHGIPLIHDRGGKHAFFVWKKAYLQQGSTAVEGTGDSDEAYGSVQYNPLESVPVGGPHGETMRGLAALYRQRKIREVAEALSAALSQDPHDEGLSYGLAVCLARAGMLSEAKDVLAHNLNASSHPRYRRLFDDLSRWAESPRPQPTSTPQRSSKAGGVTLFAMPKAFAGHTATIQRNAIRSWAKLDPTPEIILFGDEPGIREMAREVGAKHVAQVERNEFGTPLVDKLFEAAQDHASHEVLAYVNADMILLQDFLTGAQAVQSSLANFLVIGRRWDLVVLDEIDFSASQWRESLSNRVREDATLHAESGLDYFIFRRGLWPKIPPFAIGRTAWDNWLVIDPQRRGVPVVDGTEFITAVHQEHDYGHVRGGRQAAWNGEEAARNKSLAGPVDESAYTTGATWALSREGRLARAQPRPAQVGTATFRSRRIAWLAKQAGLLMARREMTLAACMWEETLALMDKLMPSHGPTGALPRFSQDSPMTRSYATACVSLAGCYEKMGELRKAAATCTKLLEMPRIELPDAQRGDIARRRDALLERASRQAVLPEGSSVDRDGPSKLPCERCKRIALIVSIPERSEGLRGVIRDIEGQVDEIRILLNEFETVPQDLYGCKKVSWVATNRTGDGFASGAWTLLRPDDEGYVVVLDDDIEYPPDYVERMIGVVEERQRQAVAVVHGIDYCEPFEDCTRDRTVYRFEVACRRDGVVDAGGVGTLVFHTSTIRPCLEDFPNPYFRDLWFAVLAARSGVPLVCVARDAHWLRPRPIEGRQLWYKFGDQNWKQQKNQVFREHLLPLLDMKPDTGHARRRDFTVVCITNGRSTFEYSVRSVMESRDLQDRVEGISGMHFMDAAAKCIELSETPYFFKVDDDFFLHPAAIAYMRKKVLEHPRPEKLGMYYCHLWEDWTSRVRESIKVYNVEALKKIGGFKADQYGKVDRTTLARLQEAGYEIVADPSVVAIHACGSWQEQLEYERLWSSMGEQPYRKPTHDAMEKYCGTKSLDEQYEMRCGFLEQVNRQLDTPFQEFLAQGTTARRDVSRIEAPSRKADAAVVRGPTQPPIGSRVTIFAMPKPFTGHIGTIQKNAIRSWARLDPAPEILLFGDEPGTREMAEEVGAQHIPEVSRNEFGTPLVDELFQVAQELASHEVLAYVNADIILFQDFTQAAQQVQTRLKSFLLIGQRWDLAILDEIDFGRLDWSDSLLQRLREDAMLHAESGLDYFVFRRGLWPQIPPFAIGRTAWDNWLVMDPQRRGVPVVDGTEYVTAVHQDHDYGHVSGGRREVWGGEEAARNRKLAGPADPTGLTTGATWLLRNSGELAETPPRQPRYATVEYREQRSDWLLRQAQSLLQAGADELAASQCEEAIGCIDTWLQLEREGRVSADPERGRAFGERYAAAHVVLAQCYMKMGYPERVVATYTRLLEHPVIQLAPVRRDEILRVRDRLACWLEAMTLSADSPADVACEFARSMDNPVPTEDMNVATERRPKVTVITACHNSERYLKECVDSVLGQTMTQWELFLIDDGSSDATPRLIEEYARRDARIKSFHFPDNRGPYMRRNFGIARAASQFIVIQDADDIMAPTKLERLHREIRSDSRLAIVGSSPCTFLEEFRGLEHTETGNPPVDSDTIVASCARWQAMISHGTGIIRKSLFDEIGLYDENPFAADAFWSAKLALYAETGVPVKMANVPEALTLIRIHSSSQTQMLPVFDPRSRRLRYRHYCDCKLQRIREKWRRQPALDVAAELRNCDCSDFLMRFKAKILQWESELLPADFLNELLAGAAAAFRTRSYVSCVVVLNGLEVMHRGIARRVMGFDLFRAMALHALDLCDRARIQAQREVENHDSAIARRFLQDSQEQGASMAVDRWCAEHAPRLELRLGNADSMRVRVATT